MLPGDICLKIYLWPYLSYLANLKGLCSSYYANNPAFFPIITLPPGVTLGTTVPTFQPTPATTATTTTRPTPVTLNPTTPTIPTTLTPTTVTTQTPTTPTTAPPTQPPTTVTQVPVTCPAYPETCLPGGQRPNPNCPCIDPRNNSSVKRQAGPVGSEIMVFSSLDNRRRRRRRRRRSVFQN